MLIEVDTRSIPLDCSNPILKSIDFGQPSEWTRSRPGRLRPDHHHSGALDKHLEKYSRLGPDHIDRIALDRLAVLRLRLGIEV